MKLFAKETVPVLSERLADRMLSNIFEACQAEPPTVSLETLLSYSRYRRERFSFQKIILVIILLLFCLLPFLFISPNIDLKADSEAPSYLPSYQITVDSLLPVRNVYAEVDGQRVLVTAAADHSYTAEPRVNGTLSVTVTLVNNQYQTVTTEISAIDVTPPTCLSHSQEDGVVTLTLDDENSGVDYENITALDGNGSAVVPLRVDAESQTAVFAAPDDVLDVYVPDLAGNTLHLRLTTK